MLVRWFLCMYQYWYRFSVLVLVFFFLSCPLCRADTLFLSPHTELPWDQPSSACQEYLCWKENKYTTATPWSKLDTLTLSLLRKILVPSPSQRLTLDKIQDHKWCQMQFHHNSQGKSKHGDSNVLTLIVLICCDYFFELIYRRIFVPLKIKCVIVQKMCCVCSKVWKVGNRLLPVQVLSDSQMCTSGDHCSWLEKPESTSVSKPVMRKCHISANSAMRRSRLEQIV